MSALPKNVVTLVQPMKPPVKKHKKHDGVTEHPIHPSINEHYEIILASYFPMSWHVQDLGEISSRITEWRDDWSMYTFSIAWNLLLAFRCEGKLVLNLYLTPCDGADSYRSLLELTKISDARTFRKHFDTVGVTYKNTTAFNSKKGDKFDGKLFLCISGNGHVKTKYMLNLDAAENLGKLIGVVPHIHRKKKGNGYTILSNYSNPYKPNKGEGVHMCTVPTGGSSA